MTEAWTDIRKRVEILKDAERTGADLSPRDFDLMAFYDDAVVLLAVVRAIQELQERPPLSDTYEAMFERGEQLDRTLAALPEHLK